MHDVLVQLRQELCGRKETGVETGCMHTFFDRLGQVLHRQAVKRLFIRACDVVWQKNQMKISDEVRKAGVSSVQRLNWTYGQLTGHQYQVTY